MPSASVQQLYQVFAEYPHPGTDFCSVCYSPEQIAEITRTPARLLDADTARELLWESSDHWENSDVYRHYLPRILEVMGPPWNEEPMYPLHLSESLLALGYASWPSNEQTAVLDFLESDVRFEFDESDQRDWAAGLSTLRRSIVGPDPRNT